MLAPGAKRTRTAPSFVAAAKRRASSGAGAGAVPSPGGSLEVPVDTELGEDGEEIMKIVTGVGDARKFAGADALVGPTW